MNKIQCHDITRHNNVIKIPLISISPKNTKDNQVKVQMIRVSENTQPVESMHTDHVQTITQGQ